MKHALILVVAATVAETPTPAQDSPPTARQIDGYQDFNYGQIQDGVEQWVQAIRVSEPELRSKIRGDVTVRFRAAGMTEATALCWQHTDSPDRWGKDVKSNMVVFRENKARDFQLEWAGNLEDGWTGVTGVQIVERP